jgi:uncharacterized membrane protein (DUF106 family)
MAVLNALLDRTFDLLLGPLAPLPVLLSLSIVSMATAITVLLVARTASDQPALVAVKRQIHADLFEIRLFRDDLRSILRAQSDILRHNATYLRLSIVPMLWIVLPFVLIVAQLESRFGYSGIPIGQPVAVTTQLKATGPESPSAALETPAGIHVETPAIWLPALRQVVWLVAADRAGDYVLRVRIQGETYDKTLHVADGLTRRSTMRREAGFIDQALHPSEAPLPASAPVASIGVAYPESQITLFGWRFGWMAVYLVESMIFALFLRTPMRVTV